MELETAKVMRSACGSISGFTVVFFSRRKPKHRHGTILCSFRWRVRRLRSGFILFVVVLAGLSFAVPAEDVPATVYDESESLPYLSSTVSSIAMPQTVARASAAPRHASLLRVGSLRTLGTQRLGDGTGSAYPICDSLTILDHSLRC